MSMQRDINEYLDGRLPPARREAFKAALATDAELARQTAEMQRVKELLVSLPLERAPLDLTASIMAQVRQAPVPLRHPAVVLHLLEWTRPRRLAAATVAAALLVAIGYSVRPDVPTGEPRGERVQLAGAPLSGTEQAFLSQVEREYHSLIAATPTVTTVSVETFDDVVRDF